MHSKLHPGLATVIVAFGFLVFPLIYALCECIRRKEKKEKSPGYRYAPFCLCIFIFPAGLFGGLYLGARYGSLPDSLAYPFFITWRGTTLLSVFVVEISSVFLPLTKLIFDLKIFDLKFFHFKLFDLNLFGLKAIDPERRATITIAGCLLAPHVAALIIGIWQIHESHNEAVWALPAGCHLISAVFAGILTWKMYKANGVTKIRQCIVNGVVNLGAFGCSVGFLGALLVGKSYPYFELQCTFCIIPVISKIILKPLLHVSWEESEEEFTFRNEESQPRSR